MNLMHEMTAYYRGDPKRIQHFTKVYTYCDYIAQCENMTQDEYRTLLAASLVHDIGIKNAEAKYGTCTGKQQETEGPPEARRMLEKLGFEQKTVERVCYLVGHHHTYTAIDGLDYQILVEADFLVNFYEDAVGKDEIACCMGKIFRTTAGKQLCADMYGLSVQ